MDKTLQDLKDQLSPSQILLDGSILSFVLGVMILLSLWYNPEIWHDDYPPQIQEKALPMSKKAKKQRGLVALPFFGATIGMLVGSNERLRQRNGGSLSFLASFVHTYSLMVLFNLFDFLVVDYLIMLRMKPQFAILPGTDRDDPAYGDTMFHFAAFLKGFGFTTIPALLIALLTLPRRRANLPRYISLITNEDSNGFGNL